MSSSDVGEAVKGDILGRQTRGSKWIVSLGSAVVCVVLPRWLRDKESACNRGTCVRSLGWKDPLDEGLATHPSILAWEIPWTEEPGRLQSMGSQRVRYD